MMRRALPTSPPRPAAPSAPSSIMRPAVMTGAAGRSGRGRARSTCRPRSSRYPTAPSSPTSRSHARIGIRRSRCPTRFPATSWSVSRPGRSGSHSPGRRRRDPAQPAPRRHRFRCPPGACPGPPSGAGARMDRLQPPRSGHHAPRASGVGRRLAGLFAGPQPPRRAAGDGAPARCGAAGCDSGGRHGLSACPAAGRASRAAIDGETKKVEGNYGTMATSPAPADALGKADADMAGLQMAGGFGLLARRRRILVERHAAFGHRVGHRRLGVDRRRLGGGRLGRDRRSLLRRAKPEEAAAEAGGQLKAGAEAKAAFDEAQSSVKALLKDLAPNAMAKWEAAKTVLTTQFKSDLEIVKERVDKRHSGASGFVVGLWDAVTGLPGWATDAYDRAEKNFADGVIEKLTAISAEVNSVIAACDLIITGARERIAKIFGERRPRCRA